MERLSDNILRITISSTDFSAVLGLAMRRHDTKQAEIPQYKDYTDLELSPEYE